MPAVPRVLLVFGSQTGQTAEVAKTLAEKLKLGCEIQTMDTMSGNEFAHEIEELSALTEAYDVMLVCTSSFGKGDPPHNFKDFLARIARVVEAGDKPLIGLQYAVLGEGSSVYKSSFQNCPRLTDKYLEQCGARRLVPRHEVDMGGSDGDEWKIRNHWCDAVQTQLIDLPDPKSASNTYHEWDAPHVSHKEPVTDRHEDHFAA